MESDFEPFPFVVARGRSGTTLLRAILDAHPSMAIPGESHFVVQFAKQPHRYETNAGFSAPLFLQDLFDHWAFRRWGLDPQEVLDSFARLQPGDLPSAFRAVYGAYASAQGKPRSGDKTPSYVLHVDLLAEVFPESVFIHLIRDGRDVALSYLDTDFGVRTLGQAAINWDRSVRAGRAAGERLGPSRYREIRYEELVREPERVIRHLCPFVGIPFHDRMLRYYERAGDLLPTISHAEHHRNIHRPPTAGLRDWRGELSREDVAVFEALAGDLLDELGYEREASSGDPRTRFVAARFRAGTAVRRVAHGARVRTRKARKRVVRAIVGRPARRPTTPLRHALGDRP